MKKPRYIIKLTLLQRDEANPHRDPMIVHDVGLWRTRVEGEARVVFDSIRRKINDQGYSYDNDPITREKP